MNQLHGCNYIANKTSKLGSKTYQSVNPETKEIHHLKFHEATIEEIDQAAQYATDAFEILQNIPTEKIADFLKEVLNQIYQLEDQLVEVAKWETALPLKRLENERLRTCNQLELFADYIMKGDYVESSIDTGDLLRNPLKPDIRKMMIPIGPILVFPASNFPFAFGVCGGDTASAWAAKCPVIIKAHPSHPQTSELFAIAVQKAVEKTNVPPGIFSMIHSRDTSTIQKLITHRDIEGIGFTGSQYAGRMIFDIACSRKKPIPVFAEMGSINPILLSQKVVEEKAKNTAAMLIDSITLGVGQFCTKPGVIFIPKSASLFIKELSKKIKDKDIGILLNENIKKNLHDQMNQTKQIEHVTLLEGGEEITGKNAYENTLLITDSATYMKSHHLQTEHFGPIAIVVTYSDNEDLLELVNQLEGQLTASIHLLEPEYETFKPILLKLMQKAGRIIINGVPTGVEVGYSQNHGGPYPATTAAYTTSVGVDAIKRFLRPIALQDMPQDLLPVELQNINQKHIFRRINGEFTKSDIT